MMKLLSIELDPVVSAELEREAQAERRTTAAVATRAVEAYLKAKTAKRSAIGEALAEADQGLFMSRQTVDRWVRSWGNDKEEPAPRPDLDEHKG